MVCCARCSRVVRSSSCFSASSLYISSGYRSPPRVRTINVNFRPVDRLEEEAYKPRSFLQQGGRVERLVARPGRPLSAALRVTIISWEDRAEVCGRETEMTQLWWVSSSGAHYRRQIFGRFLFLENTQKSPAVARIADRTGCQITFKVIQGQWYLSRLTRRMPLSVSD